MSTTTKDIKKLLKENGIKASVRKSSSVMYDCFWIKVSDELLSNARELTKQFENGCTLVNVQS